MIVTITRFTDTACSYPTLGMLSVGALFRCVTLENPWKNNERNVSCIPPGDYPLVLGAHGKEPGRYPCYEILDVPGRDLIDIHVGNTSTDTLGCPLVGDRFGVLYMVLGVLNSRKAHDEFMVAMHDIKSTRIVIDYLSETMI